METQEKKLEELKSKVKKLKSNFFSEINSINFSNSEMYKQLIQVSKNFPELTELIEFIIFLSDTQNTNNEVIKNIVKDGFDETVKSKIECLEILLEIVKILKDENNENIKEQEKSKNDLQDKIENKINEEQERVEEIPVSKKILLFFSVDLPKSLMYFFQSLTKTKIGNILLLIFCLVFLIRFFPTETKFILNEVSGSVFKSQTTSIQKYKK